MKRVSTGRGRFLCSSQQSLPVLLALITTLAVTYLFPATLQAEPLLWETSKAHAIALAQAQGKQVLLVAGRDTCANTNYMRHTVCESTSPAVKQLVLDHYIPWYSDVDSSTEWYLYATGLGGFTLPLICRIDPNHPDSFLDRTTGIQQPDAFFSRLQALFSLAFPLAGYSPYTAPVTSVFDHSMSASYQDDGKVIAYTGERGEKAYGRDWVWGTHYGFKNISNNSFLINGNYTGGGNTLYLYYDGHPGFDYSTKDLGSSVPVLAAASGTAYRGNLGLGEVYIDHENDYRTYYLHLLVDPGLIANNTPVAAGQALGIAGGTGGFPVHLHFEVRKKANNSTYVPVDPYGWNGCGTDLYTNAENGYLWAGAVPTPSLCWRSGESDLGGGWKQTGWFGMYNTNFEPWIYHAQHGWLYPYDNGDGAVFFWYSDMNQFVWTTPTTYPFLYRFDVSPSWLWYVKGSASPRKFYDYGAGAWENLP